MSTGPLGEDVQDQAGAIQHAALKLTLQVALLAGTERMVEYHDFRFVLAHFTGYFLQLSAADKRARVWRRPGAHDIGDRVTAGSVTRYFYDGVNLAIQPEARTVRATQGGRPLEVEMAMRELPNVKNAVVTARRPPDEDARLVAYVVPHLAPFDAPAAKFGPARMRKPRISSAPSSGRKVTTERMGRLAMDQRLCPRRTKAENTTAASRITSA